MTLKELLHEDWDYCVAVEEWTGKKWTLKCFKYFKFVQKEDAEKWAKQHKNNDPFQRVTMELVKAI